MNKKPSIVTILIIVVAIFYFGSAMFSGNPSPTPVTEEPMKNDQIEIEAPLPNQLVQSPLIIQGKAKGNWFFEGSFPVTLVYGPNPNEQVTVPATATDEWMTEEFVPFTARIEFATPQVPTGKLIFRKDNPSGLPENDASVSINVRFKE